MNAKLRALIVFQALAAAIALGPTAQSWAKNRDASYSNMAPIDQYLMADRDIEIALARSAAPPSISHDAEVLVLGPHGYKIAVKGINGFVCLVERSWMSPFDSREFWNPKLRGPICYNPPAVRSVLPLTFKRTALAFAESDKNQMLDSIKTALQKRQLPMPESGAMSYMMSKEGYLGDTVGHWHPHLMFHIPRTDAVVSRGDTATWGANLPGSPVVLNTQYLDVPEPEIIFMVPVDHWSDGTPAPLHH
jgi:hypothetical protein